MLRFIMEKNVLLYVLAAACAVGVVSQIILRRIYDGLLRDTRNTGEPEGRFLQQLRQRFQYCAHLNGKVGDVHALIQKSMLEYRPLGLSLHTLQRLAGGCLTVSLLCAAIGTIVRAQGGAELVTGNIYFWLGAGAMILTGLAYGIADNRYHSQSLEICLSDYLQNGLAAGACEQEEEIPDLAYEPVMENSPNVAVLDGRRAKKRPKTEAAASRSKTGAKERMRAQKESELVRLQREDESVRAQREKSELKENLARVKAGMQESAASESDHAGASRGAQLLRQMDPKEQERLIREVLSEFLSQ